MALSILVSARRVSSPRFFCWFFLYCESTRTHTHTGGCKKRAWPEPCRRLASSRWHRSCVIFPKSLHIYRRAAFGSVQLYRGCGRGLCPIPGSVKFATHPKGGSTCWAPWEGRTEGTPRKHLHLKSEKIQNKKDGWKVPPKRVLTQKF